VAHSHRDILRAVHGVADRGRVRHVVQFGAPQRLSRRLLGRRGRPEDVAAAVCFLAGQKARYLTGQTIHVNGGVFLP
jgi:3-oxoacyl-[acyl-carrier protein] reductase